MIAVSNSWLLAGGYYEPIFISVLNKIGSIPQSIILSLQLREAEVPDVERDTGAPGTAIATPLAGFAGASVSLQRDMAGTELTALLMLGNKAPTIPGAE